MVVAVIIGTRPEIIKMSPVIVELQSRGAEFFVIHTGQHYSHNLDKIFFEELELPAAKYNLEVGSGTHGEETGKMLIGIEKSFMKEKVDLTGSMRWLIEKNSDSLGEVSQKHTEPSEGGPNAENKRNRDCEE